MNLNELATDIKLLLLDVDGVLTDGRVWMDSTGKWKRYFCVKDGVGIQMLQDIGCQTAVITGGSSEDVRERVKFLGINYFFEGQKNKVPAFEELLRKSSLIPKEIAFIGDEIFDVPILENVGFPVTVPDAAESVKGAAKYITKSKGGFGAVREVCDLIFQYSYS